MNHGLSRETHSSVSKVFVWLFVCCFVVVGFCWDFCSFCFVCFGFCFIWLVFCCCFLIFVSTARVAPINRIVLIYKHGFVLRNTTHVRVIMIFKSYSLKTKIQKKDFASLD